MFARVHDALTDIPGWAQFVLVLAAGVVVSGFADAALTNAGLENWGVLVWVIGYVGTILVLWAGWVRPIEFGSEDGTAGDSEAGSE